MIFKLSDFYGRVFVVGVSRGGGEEIGKVVGRGLREQSAGELAGGTKGKIEVTNI